MSFDKLLDPSLIFVNEDGKARKFRDVNRGIFNPLELGKPPEATTQAPKAKIKSPLPVDAEALAKEERDKNRRIRARSGGNTLLTTESLAGTSGQKTLLGS